jgi:hypothetical protein
MRDAYGGIKLATGLRVIISARWTTGLLMRRGAYGRINVRPVWLSLFLLVVTGVNTAENKPVLKEFTIGASHTVSTGNYENIKVEGFEATRRRKNGAARSRLEA